MAQDYRLSKEGSRHEAHSAQHHVGAGHRHERRTRNVVATGTLAALKREGVIPSNTTTSAYLRMLNVYSANVAALQAYRPSPANVAALPPLIGTCTRARTRDSGPLLHVLRASMTNAHLRSYAGSNQADFGWSKVGLPANCISCHRFDGDHYGPCRTAPRACIAKIMRQLLQPRDTRSPRSSPARSGAAISTVLSPSMPALTLSRPGALTRSKTWCAGGALTQNVQLVPPPCSPIRVCRRGHSCGLGPIPLTSAVA